MVDKSKKSNEKLDDWNGFYEELQSESPRAAVIVAAAFLDAQLRELLAAFCIEDSKEVSELLGGEDKPDRPLSTFSSRIRAAYCLGLISKKLKDDLNTIRKIRNKFAHQLHGYSFDEPKIVSWCNSLELANMITDAVSRMPAGHGDKFVLGVVQLSSWLAMETLKVSQNRRTLPKDPRIAGFARAGDSTETTS